MTEQVKAKRRLTDISFDHDGSHVALVGKFQGGPANGVETLLYKSASTDNVLEKASEEEIHKAVEINLKLPLMEFLTRYIYLDIDEAEMIAGLLGYSYEDIYNEEDTVESFRETVQRNLDKITISESDNDDETSRVKRQKQTEQFIESFSDFDDKFFMEKNSQSSAKRQDEDVVNKAEDKETKPKTKEGTNMTQETNVQKSELELELEKAKAQLADLEKAQEEAAKARQEKADLEKSFAEVNKTVEVLKAAEERRKEEHYLAKAKEHVLVVTDENPAQELAKAMRIAEETEGCEALVKAFEAYRDTASKSDALEEIGKSKTDDQPSGSKLDAAIEKAKEAHSVDYMKALEIVQKEQPELFADEYRF